MSDRLTKLEAALAALKELVKAERDSARQCEKHGKLPINTRRAKMTSMNARWSILAEHRDRMEARFIAQLAVCGYAEQPAKAGDCGPSTARLDSTERRHA